MKIMLLTSSLGAGGAERVATTLCNAWAERGDDVTLVPTFSGGGEPFYPVFGKVALLNLAEATGATHKSFWSYVLRLYTLRRLIVGKRPDVIVSFLPNVNVATILASAFLSIPLIICERSDPSIRPQSGFWYLSCKLLYRFASMLTVQTASVASKVRVAFPNVKSIRVIPNPVPNDLLSYFLKPSRGRKKLLSIGRLSEEKQVDRIINAFAEIKSGFDDWDLYIYGDGSSRAKIAMQVESLKLTDRAFILGSTTQPWEVMSNADVFVMASQYEGFPNALLEAMAIGLPCVAFDCPSGPREISSDGKNAILVALNDQAGLVAALTQIMDDEELRRSLGGRAKDSVRGKFSLAAVMENWDELFGEVGAIPRRLGVSVLTHGSETLS